MQTSELHYNRCMNIGRRMLILLDDIVIVESEYIKYHWILSTYIYWTFHFETMINIIFSIEYTHVVYTKCHWFLFSMQLYVTVVSLIIKVLFMHEYPKENDNIYLDLHYMTCHSSFSIDSRIIINIIIKRITDIFFICTCSINFA